MKTYYAAYSARYVFRVENLPRFKPTFNVRFDSCFSLLKAGVLDSVFIPRDEMGVGNFAFITYRNAADVPFALCYFQGTWLLGRLMVLRLSGQITPFNRHLRFDNGNYVVRTH